MPVSVGTRSSEGRTGKVLRSWLQVSEPLWLSGKQSLSVLVRLMDGASGLLSYTACIYFLIMQPIISDFPSEHKGGEKSCRNNVRNSGPGS